MKIPPLKRLGQHRLMESEFLDKAIAAISPENYDQFIEIGAGAGNLTERLAEKAGRVIAIEIDSRLRAALLCVKVKFSNLDILFEDFLKTDLPPLLSSGNKKWRVAGNIPYNITTPIVTKLIEEGRDLLDDIHLMVQKEVARRFASPPGSKEYGAISIFIQYYTEPTVLFEVPRENFSPPPKVDSAFIRLKIRESPPVEVPREMFFRVVRTSFRFRRKQMRNCLKAMGLASSLPDIDLLLNESGISPDRRPETLSIEEFAGISRRIQESITS